MKLSVTETPTGREWTIVLTEREALHVSRETLTNICHIEGIPIQFVVLLMKSDRQAARKLAENAVSGGLNATALALAFAIVDERTRLGPPKNPADIDWMEEELKRSHKNE